jgi:hypothetical protein
MVAKIAEIVAYWRKHQDESGLSVDWAEAHERCWRCGYKRRLQKCHIIPRSLGGSDDAENLVLLCKFCHRENPNVTDPSFMWLWLRAHALPFYGTYWIHRGFEEFEKLFKRKPFSDVDPDISPEKIREALECYKERICIHFGEGRFNPSTIAWILSQVEKQFSGSPGRTKQ